MTLVYVAMGGAVGACLRFLITNLMTQICGRDFPYGTLTVNIFGSFIMGMGYCLLSNAQLPGGEHMRLFLMVGLLGALTTFSTFSLDTLQMMQQAQLLKALLNVTTNVVFCLVAVYVGQWLTQRFI